MMEDRGIGFWLTKRDLISSSKEAVVDGNRRLSFTELNRRVNKLSNSLKEMGVKYGDRVSVLSYNSLEFLEVIFACAKLGLILVPLNWRLTAPELSFIADNSGAETLFFDPAFSSVVDALKGKTPFKRFITIGDKSYEGASKYDEIISKQKDHEPVPDKKVGLETPHIIMYTAGTTGKPKGAVLTQGASFWNAVNTISCIDITSQDRTIVVLPMFHIGGIGLFMLPQIYMGGTSVIVRTFEPLKVLEIIEKEKISIFMGVPAVFLFLAEQDKLSALKNVRVVMCGGAPLPISLIQRYHDSGIKLRQGFGMSEAAPSIAILDDRAYLKKAGSIGKALMHLEVRVVDDDMKDVKPNDVGELIMRGPNVMIEYWNRADATKEAFAGGWFHSGDMARMDEEGYLYIVERKKDMFISGGENVYPAEVENAIYELPQIGEAAVIGIQDEKWGEVGKAIVVVKAGQKLSEDQILDHLKSRLAKFKVPKSVVFIDQLPRNAAGKVLKNDLRTKFSK